MILYEYSKCSTCRKAIQFLDKKKVAYKKKDITETPPTLQELKKMLKHYELKRLLNTSGQVYREIGKEKISRMSESELLQLLSKNGRLIKRPFLFTPKRGLVGFKEEEWKAAF